MKAAKNCSSISTRAAAARKPARPRLGFLGVGWIGRQRMEAIARSGLAEVAAIADASPEVAAQAASAVPGAAPLRSFDEMLEAGVDGVVIATPSALHAEQAVAALERGLSVFCQKPLARNAEETRRVVDAARAADRLLGVDLSYRFIDGMKMIRRLIRDGELGEVFAVDLVFHNAYGPDKAWFYDPQLSGGGCVIDLGVHLVDLALWALDFPPVRQVSSRLFARGRPLVDRESQVEDFAAALITLASGTSLQLACSWNLPAGCDAVIEAGFYGARGGAALRNVNGSFYDFVAERFQGRARQPLCESPDDWEGDRATDGADDWGGRAAVDWAGRVAGGEGFDSTAEYLIDVAATLDMIYGG
jgi:predicted dehydrogenase